MNETHIGDIKVTSVVYKKEQVIWKNYQLALR